jgi:hypothetical protein
MTVNYEGKTIEIPSGIPVREALKMVGVDRFYSLTSAEELLQQLCKDQPRELVEAIEAESTQFSCKPFNLK